RSEISCDRCHDPVAGGLRPSAAVDVPRGRELALESAAQPRLLLHLADGGRFLALAVLALALRERPVVVGRTVDEQDLGGAPAAVAHDDAARRSDGVRHIQARSFGSASSSQAVRQRPRSSAAVDRSPAASASAAPTALGSPFSSAHALSHAPATTESLSSPRSSWSRAAACANARACLPTTGAAASAA